MMTGAELFNVVAIVIHLPFPSLHFYFLRLSQRRQSTPRRRIIQADMAFEKGKRTRTDFIHNKNQRENGIHPKHRCPISCFVIFVHQTFGFSAVSFIGEQVISSPPNVLVTAFVESTSRGINVRKMRIIVKTHLI
ncbi:hypothetical protein CRE_02417 [Caenorhabditis remanei]|uniref:Uncharacterized protein n=1 Tax=Caenorhabditis remanei TaxID=31234 RepID=E3MIN9_CAERE|nr:hypothetical protein CRE_02417 [Caenorhabditis remanei]